MAYKVRTEKYSVSIEGADEIVKILKDIGVEANAVLEAAATAGAEIAYADAKAKAPVGEGKKYGAKPHPPGNLRDSIKIVKARKSGAGKVKGRATASVKYDTKKAFYAPFVEFGTKHSRANPVLRNAIDKNKAKIATVVNAMIAAALRKAVLV